MSEIELKPCPFCGNKAHLAEDERGVVCTYCGAKMQYDLDPGRKLAIKAWNATKKSELERKCVWETRNTHFNETSCGGKINDFLIDESYLFCPNCGGKIEVKE